MKDKKCNTCGEPSVTIVPVAIPLCEPCSASYAKHVDDDKRIPQAAGLLELRMKGATMESKIAVIALCVLRLSRELQTDHIDLLDAIEEYCDRGKAEAEKGIHKIK